MKLFTWTTYLSIWLATTPLWAQTNPSDSLGAARILSLAECLAYAYEHNEILQNAALDQRIAKADVGVTKAQGLPQLNGNIDYNNNFAIQTQFLPAAFFAEDPTEVPADAPPVPVRFGVPHTSTAGVSASQMIFDGSYFVGLKAARTYTDLMQKEYFQSKITTTEQVSKAYYTVLVNQVRQKLTQSNYMRLDTLLYETQLMFENGFAEAIEVDRIRVQFNNAKTEQENLNRLTEVSYLLLKFQMGMPMEQELRLADEISDIDVDFNLQQEIDFEYADRVEYAILRTNQDLVKLDLRNNRIRYLPKLSANASLGYNTGVDQFNDITNFDELWFQYGFFGVNLDIPIFDGLRKRNQIQKNKLQFQQLENLARQMKNNIDLEIVQARTTLENNLAQLNVQEENLQLAQKVFDVAKIKYQEGVGSNIEVVTAEDELQAAETNYFGALYDALIAKVDLEKALGQLLEE